VMKVPRNRADTVNRCKILLDDLDGNYTVSDRAMTHIHCDVRELTTPQRYMFALGLVAMEDYFFSFTENRKESNFCVPLLYNPALAGVLDKVKPRRPRADDDRMWQLEPPHAADIVDRADLKYASVNTMPINKLGSIELRHFNPLVGDGQVEEILTRVDRLYDAVEDRKLGVDATRAMIGTALTKIMGRDEILQEYLPGTLWGVKFFKQLGK